MKNRWIILLSGMLILSIASFAAARLVSGRMLENRAPCAGLAMLQDYLELSPGQKKAMADVDAEFGASRPVLKEQVWAARGELLDVLKDPNAKKSDIIAVTENFGSAQQALQRNTIEYVFALREYLTPAQKEKLVELMSSGICSLTSQPASGRNKADGGGFCGMGNCGNGHLGKVHPYKK